MAFESDISERGRFSTGMYVSAGGHGALLLWLAVGGFFITRDDMSDISSTDVSIISVEDFEAMRPQSPQAGEEPPVPAPTQAPQDSTPEISTETAPAIPQAPAPTQTSPPDTVPQTVREPVAQPDPPTDVPVQPDAPLSTDPGAVLILPDSAPSPPAAERVAPEVVDAPAPDAAVDDVVRAETAPAADADIVEQAQEDTAPEEATTQIVTEADVLAGALTRSPRPGARPDRPAPPPAPELAPELEPDAEVVHETPGLQDIINDTVRDVTAGSTVASSGNAVENNANAGGGTSSPITREEKGAFILGIQRCWNVGALGTDALQVSVVIGFSMDPGGVPQGGSIRMLSSSGGTGDAVNRAYEAARRAIIRCGAQGYGLPADKYDQWRQVEVTFNASRKQIR